MTLSRYAVFSGHLIISALLLCVLFALMWFYWYPKGLFTIAGGWQGMQILAPIDLVLGPLLTLMFYRPGKPAVIRDLTIIACVQIAALSYGLQAVYSQRPIALAFAEGEFVAITPQDAKEANALLLEKDYQPINLDTLSKSTPAIVVARPIPREEYGAYVASLFNDMPELAMRSDRYEPAQDYVDILKSAAIDSPDSTSADGAAWFRLNTKYGKGLIQVHIENGSLQASKSPPRGDTPRAQALQQPPNESDPVHNLDEK